MVQRLLGLGLVKGHGAADWSKRPLPMEWLNYAALDVEVLIELRTAIAAALAEQGKTDWAAQEFEYLRTVKSGDAMNEVAPAVRRDRWRRTSGIHKVRDPRGLAAVRELWLTRESIAQRRDVAPRRILPDTAIIDAAVANPKTVDELIALPVFGGRHQRRSAATWFGPWNQPGRTAIRRMTPSHPTRRRRLRGGAGANPKPRYDWKRPGRRCLKC